MVNNLYILAQKQGNSRDHMNHTRKIDDYPQKIFFSFMKYQIRLHKYEP